VSNQAKNASAIVDEAHNAGLDGSHPVTLQARMLRLELLDVKAELEREFGRLVLHCSLSSDCPSDFGARRRGAVALWVSEDLGGDAYGDHG
jgi:hypothetical protein